MVERRETQFQRYTLFICTGKVAGFINRRIMVYPPELAQDYVFIVVLDTWTFYDKAELDSIAALPSATTPTKRPSTDIFDKAKFMSPSKQAAQ